MSNPKRLQFFAAIAAIAAPPAVVYGVMIDPDSYRLWASAFFTEGSYY